MSAESSKQQAEKCNFGGTNIVAAYCCTTCTIKQMHTHQEGKSKNTPSQSITSRRAAPGRPSLEPCTLEALLLPLTLKSKHL